MFTSFSKGDKPQFFGSYDPHLKGCLVFHNIASSKARTRSSSPVFPDKIVLDT